MSRDSVFKLELFCECRYGVRRLVAAFESADESAHSKCHQPDRKGGSQANGNAARPSN
jgi:hypothetical protein